MNSTLVSFSVPNLITVNLQFWTMFLVAVLIWQVLARRKGMMAGGAGDDSGGGY